MKIVRIVPYLLFVAVASAAVVMLRPPPKSLPVPRPVVAPVGTSMPDPVLEAPSNEASVIVQEPVQPLEDRGDAMLFEIDALQNTPFDQPATIPFD